MNADSPEGADLVPASALAFPPCECGIPGCPVAVVADEPPEHSRADDDSPTMQRIREKMAKEKAERGRGGGWL
ncbi:hypothetical protein [Streptomyces sp. NPDC055036]